MAWDINQVTIIGRLTKDPELRHTQSGFAVCPLSIAVNRNTGKEDAKEEVYFFDVITFGKNAEVCEQYLSKGKRVAVEGYLRQSRWQDQNGTRRSKVEIVSQRVQFLTSPTNYESTPANKKNINNTPKEEQYNTENYDDFSEDDEIPF